MPGTIPSSLIGTPVDAQTIYGSTYIAPFSSPVSSGRELMNRRDFIKAGSVFLAAGRRLSAQTVRVARRAIRDVVVVIPGIMGSVLQKDGKDLWALSGQALVGGLRSLNRNIDQLRLSSDSVAPDLGDGIVATRVMPDVHLIASPTLDRHEPFRGWLPRSEAGCQANSDRHGVNSAVARGQE
jgi:hypothetical protein